MCTFLSHCFETKNYHWCWYILSNTFLQKRLTGLDIAICCSVQHLNVLLRALHRFVGGTRCYILLFAVMYTGVTLEPVM